MPAAQGRTPISTSFTRWIMPLTVPSVTEGSRQPFSAAVDRPAGRAALVEAQPMRPGVVELRGVLPLARAVQEIAGLEQIPRQIGDAVVLPLAVRGRLGRPHDDAAGDAHHGLQQGVVAGDEPARRTLALERLPHQVALDVRLLGGRHVVLDLGDGVRATGRGAGLEHVAEALDHPQQRGVVLVLHVEGVGHVVDEALGELTGVGEALVQGLDLLLQVSMVSRQSLHMAPRATSKA